MYEFFPNICWDRYLDEDFPRQLSVDVSDAVWHSLNNMKTALRCSAAIMVRQPKAVLSDEQLLNVQEDVLVQCGRARKMLCIESELPVILESFLIVSAGLLPSTVTSLSAGPVMNVYDGIQVAGSNVAAIATYSDDSLFQIGPTTEISGTVSQASTDQMDVDADVHIKARHIQTYCVRRRQKLW